MTTVVHQFVPSLAAGDAIGSNVFAAQTALQRAGFRSEIFYDEAQASVRNRGRRYTEFDHERDGPDPWILFHLSTGSPMTEWLLSTPVPFGVYFHNITPPKFYERWAPGAADNMARARAEAKRLASRSRFAIATSEFTRLDLEGLGYGHTSVAPVLVDFAHYDSAPNSRMLARLKRETGRDGRRWLFIGRVAPNKCQHDIISAFAVYRERFNADARLTLVGGRTADVYYRTLELAIKELALVDSAELTDHIAHDEAMACLAAADVFVHLSEHEGFGVTLLEAMHAGVPVVALAAGAVAETAGDGALLLDDKDPLLVATAVNRVLTDDSLRAELIAAGRERVKEFDAERTAPMLVDSIRRAMAGEGVTGSG